MNILYKFVVTFINLSRINRFMGLRSALSFWQKIGQIMRLIFTLVNNPKYLLYQFNMNKIPNKKFALILGNGPSLGKIDWNKFYHQYNQNNTDIYCVSYFFNGIESFNLRPSYVVLSDPEHFNFLNQQTLKLINFLKNNTNIIIYCPLEFEKHLHKDLINNTIIYFNDLSLVSFTKNIKPDRIRGYISHTFMKALAIAIDRDYSKIFIAGLDGSEFLSLKTNIRNELILFPTHQSGMTSMSATGEHLDKYYPNGIVDYFYDLALTSYCYKFLLNDDRVINLNPYSYVDAFLKSDEYFVD